MIAEIICVGTELLLGNILNTNAQYLSRKLAEAGAEVHFQTVVGDNPARIMDAVRIAFTRADTIILSGGLGPTKDDMTKEKIAEFFGRKLVMDE
ncbi:MAG: competence/damage-inducible protein A, partial [Solobacterium sp.]|nr:competence/damage-inducible protein A [Solobacterium sp.]